MSTLDKDGHTTGDAFVEFASSELASQAMKKNKETIGHRKIKISQSSKAEMKRVSKRKRLMSTQPGPYDGRRKIKNFKSPKADIENVSQPKLKPLMSTQPGPYDKSPGGFGVGRRRIGSVVAGDDGRFRSEFGGLHQAHTRKDLLCEWQISAQTISTPLGTNSAILKNKQSMGGGDESETRFLGVFGGGGVPAKPTGDVVDTEKIYKMSRAPRGIAIIINNKKFLKSSGMEKYPRNGTDVDRDALEKLFKSLKFDVRIHNDITKYQIRRVAKEMASLNHSDYDAFIFSILTHGEEGLLYGTDGAISIRDLTSEFKVATTLAGKPKMFFFQACQGNRFMDGMDVPDGSDSEASSKVSVLSEADFLYAYSTVPGYYSWRNSANGSWFIRSLSKVFGENAECMDILRMLTRVNAMVSTFKSRTRRKDWDDKGQVSSTVSMLRKDLYFFPEKVTEKN